MICITEDFKQKIIQNIEKNVRNEKSVKKTS